MSINFYYIIFVDLLLIISVVFLYFYIVKIRKAIVSLFEVVSLIIERDRIFYNEIMNRYNRDKKIKDLLYKTGAKIDTRKDLDAERE